MKLRKMVTGDEVEFTRRDGDVATSCMGVVETVDRFQQQIQVTWQEDTITVAAKDLIIKGK